MFSGRKVGTITPISFGKSGENLELRRRMTRIKIDSDILYVNGRIEEWEDVGVQLLDASESRVVIGAQFPSPRSRRHG
jgi:hypothetical protein